MTQPAGSDLRRALENALAEDASRLLIGGSLLEAESLGRGLRERFGDDRVLVGPDDPSALLGLARGLSATGHHPIVRIAPADTLGLAQETLAREIGAARFRSGGGFPLAMTILLSPSGAPGAGPDLGRNPEAWLCTIPGLRVLAASPATPAGALLGTALGSGDPCVLIESRSAADDAVAHADEAARVLRTGDAVTVVTWGEALAPVLDAADAAAATGMALRVVDLVSLSPLDSETILDAASATGRLVIVQDGPRGGVDAEIAALVAERAIEYLEAPVLRVAAPMSPAPVRRDAHYRPDAARVLRAVEQVLDF